MIRSVNFAEIEPLQKESKWDEAGEVLAQCAKDLERGGATVIILATNTMHKCAGAITDAIDVPFVHIADATAAAIKAKGCKKPALMGTMYTMTQDFYKAKLIDAGLKVIVPSEEDRKTTHHIIFNELCKGTVRDESRKSYEAIAQRLKEAGADCLILGCTEIG